MSKIDTELFIARRLSRKGSGRNNVMVRIATVSVAIGMAVMILSMAVIVGFKREITDRLVGFGAHVRVVAPSESYMPRNYGFEKAIGELKDFESIAPFAEKSGIIRTEEAIQGVVLKGVSPEYDMSFFASNLVEGSLPQVDDSVRRKEILISSRTADMLRKTVGDRIEIMFVGEGSRPVRRDQFKISGIYSTGMEQMDEMMTLTDLRNVQRLEAREENMIRGYEINTADFDRLDDFAMEVYRLAEAETETGEQMLVETVTRLYPNIFDWLKAHNVNAAVIIIIMLAVALLNMVSAMLIIVLECTSMIGVLKALGMKNRAVQKIFLLRSLGIVLRGMFWGNIAGISIALIQKFTGLIKLNSSGYMLSKVPISLDCSWWLSLNIGVPLAITLLLMIPVAVVSLIKPEQTIRYQ